MKENFYFEKKKNSPTALVLKDIKKGNTEAAFLEFDL